MTPDWLIVGAGFTGCVLAERLAAAGKRVTLVDRRPHLGGNAYDALDAHGVLIHPYGPHIFHTQSQAVWDYLSRFTTWRPYEHRVLAEVDGRLIPLPFNLTALRACFPGSDLEDRLLVRFGAGARVPILKLREEPDFAELAEWIYQRVFLPYTLKQWGVGPEELDPGVTGRVPVVLSEDDRYFPDRFQAMPAQGYTAMFERMVAGIDVRLGVDFLAGGLAYDRLVFTGPIDAYFGFKHGHLPYRSLNFAHEHRDVEWVQPVAVVNFPQAPAITRRTEFKHLTGQVAPGTSLCLETPLAHEDGVTEPYYPLAAPGPRAMLARYREEAAAVAPRVMFAGRLADYQYYNMDQVVARALTLAASL
ncbi:MAG: UDP-galactopyranose mutase [Cyanobacteria bacterium RYN_339]|nr:UDP-galactopyranose mutase [Cyanobacteria bacterium RYN_339]